jgi:predicted MFS family arabinose efflux permease
LVAYASGLFFTSFMIVAMSPPVEFVALAIVIGGGGFVLLHNSLQNNATQMNPEGRGAAIAVYAFCFFVGQTIGVAISGFLFDRVGAVPLFMGSAILLPILVFWFRSGLEREQKGT